MARSVLGEPVGAAVGALECAVGDGVAEAGTLVAERPAEVGAGLVVVAVGDGPVVGVVLGDVLGEVLDEVGEPVALGELDGAGPVGPDPGSDEGEEGDEGLVPGAEEVAGAFPVPRTTTVEPPGSNRTCACQAVAGAAAWSTSIVTLCCVPGRTTPEELLRRR